MPAVAVLKQPRKIGRPSIYSDEIADMICERLATGESLRSVCSDTDMPSESTVRHWVIEDYQGFFAQYTRAREAQAEVYVDEIISISDSVAGCTDSAAVQAARLQVDARKWVAAKLLPKKYGDRTHIEAGGSVTVKVITGLGDE